MNKTQHTMELLAPAGGMEQLHAAIRFGADAVYLAGERFGMRARAANFNMEQLREAVKIAHAANVKVHTTCNVMMDNSDIDALPAYLEQLDDAGVDALIIGDVGAMRVARTYAPHCEIHVSTQASVSNVPAALAYADMGAKRVVCAREMSLEDIARLRRELPPEIEVEVFAHGAMCMAVSGRCMISAYLTGRSGNKGHCTQPCRWNYVLQEEKRPGEFFPIGEDDHGTFILNAKDMNMLQHVAELQAAGVDSIKIEGRNKKAFYVATVVNAYRQVLDGADPKLFLDEMETISHRPYSTGFYFGEPGQSHDQEGYTQTTVHVADVLGCVSEGEGYRVTVACRNRFDEGDELEVVTPGQKPFAVSVQDLHLHPTEPDMKAFQKRLKKERNRAAQAERIAREMEQQGLPMVQKEADSEPEEITLDSGSLSAAVSLFQKDGSLSSIHAFAANRAKAEYSFLSSESVEAGDFLRLRSFRSTR